MLQFNTTHEGRIKLSTLIFFYFASVEYCDEIFF